MCDPISIGVGIAAAGSVVKGVGQYQTAKANAAALDTAADQKLETAKYNIEEADRKFRRNEGTVKAQIGSTNLDLSSFSDVLDDDAKESALEKLAIKTGADIDAKNLRFQASGQRTAATMALLSIPFNVGTSVAGGYSQQAKLDAFSASKGVGFGTTDVFKE